jgi:hypothetical protein
LLDLIIAFEQGQRFAQTVWSLEPNHQVHLHLFNRKLESLAFLKAQIEKFEQQLEQSVTQSPTRHLVAIAGKSAILMAELIPVLEEWQRYETIQTIYMPGTPRCGAGLE